MVLNGQLYKHSYFKPLLKCAKPDEALRVLTKIHESHYENHLDERSMTYKTRSQRFYWPIMRANAQKYANSYDKLQRFSSLTYIPPEKLTIVFILWLFM